MSIFLTFRSIPLTTTLSVGSGTLTTLLALFTFVLRSLNNETVRLGDLDNLARRSHRLLPVLGNQSQ